MRDRHSEIAAANGRVAVVSFAEPRHLALVSKHLGHPFEWYSDPGYLCYRALGLGRANLRQVYNVRAIWRVMRHAARGDLWHPEQDDRRQLGGNFVFGPSGELTMEYRSRDSDDRPPVKRVMAAFARALESPN